MDSVGTRAVVLSAKIWTTDPDTPSAIAQGTFMLPRKQGNHNFPPMSPKEEVTPSPKGEISPIAAASGITPASMNAFLAKHWPTLATVYPGMECREVGTV